MAPAEEISSRAGVAEPDAYVPGQEPLPQHADERGALRSDVFGLPPGQLGVEVGVSGPEQVFGQGGVRTQRHKRAAGHQAVTPVGQLGAERVGDGLHRPATGLLPRHVIGEVVVGEEGERRHGHRRVRLEVVEGHRCAVHEDLEEGRIGLHPHGKMANVGQGLLAAVFEAALGHVGVLWNPQHPARDRRRPPDHVGLLDHDRPGAAVGGQSRRSQGGAARTDDDDVDDLVPRIW